MKCTLKALTLMFVALWCVNGEANSCGPPKRVKVRHACGVVIDAHGKPIDGARLQLVSPDGKNITEAVNSQADGQWFLTDAPKGEFMLSVSAPGHNSIKWPLKIKARPKGQACSQPLKVHLAGALGWGCGDWVSTK